MPVIRLEHIGKVYDNEVIPTTALDDVSLTIEKGEFVSIMGASGSGKSTLMHMIGLLDRPTKGSYWFRDQDTSTLDDLALARLRNRSIGFVFQSFHLLPRVSVAENVMLPLQYSSTPRSEWRPKAEAVLATVNMSHRLNYRPTRLSGGEKQRVAVARALVMSPDIILADEPTGNLDSKNTEAVLALLASLHAAGHTVILVTHEKEVAQRAQRMITIRDGNVASDELLVPSVSPL